MLHPDINQNETSIALLKKEVIISRELTHENIIKVYSLEKSQGRHFLTMEYVDGRHLGYILRELGKLSVRQLGSIFLQVCDALEYAHNRGVVHLDIKPGNILLAMSGNVKLCDFGIARMILGNVTTATQRLVAGSMGYMPPEQYSGRKFVTNQSDIYALGATAYHILTGRVPVGSYEHSDVPQCVRQAMAANPADRFESVKDFRRAFIQETHIGPVDLEEVRTLIKDASDPMRGFQGSGQVSVRPESDTLIVEDDLSYGCLNASTESVSPVSVQTNTEPVKQVAQTTRSSQFADTIPITQAVQPDFVGQNVMKGDAGNDRKSGGTGSPDRQPIAAFDGDASTQTPSEGRPVPERRRRIILGVGAAFFVLVVFVAAAFILKKNQIDEASGVQRVQASKYDWNDAQRNREVPVKIYHPTASRGALPAVVLSHGVGGNRDSAEYLGRYWARHGYISVHIQHRGPDPHVKPDGLPGAPVRDAAHRLVLVIDRIRDARFVLDQLERINRDDKTFKGSIDLERIGMAGHSLGAFTTLAVTGAAVPLPQGREESFVDHRIKAALVMNTPVSMRQKPVLSRMLSRVKIPCMHVAGTADRGPGGETTPEDRRLMFDNISGVDQYLITFKDSDHTVLAGRPGKSEQDAGPLEIHDLICISSTAFWDAYLKADVKAGAWLTDGGLELKLGDLATVEKKLVR